MPIIPDHVKLSIQNIRSVASGQFGQPALIGDVTNTTTRNLTYVEARSEFSNASGQVVATGLANQLGLAPGQSWHCEIAFPTETSADRGHFTGCDGQ